MNYLRPVMSILFFAGIVVFSAAVADAQATRTWISGVGDDANPCSRTAPCKTFAGSISKTAASGVINCLDPGGFGAVTITKSITIDCKGTVGGILAAGTTGIIINNATAVVRIRGVNIDGVGTGIFGVRVIAASKVMIEDSEIDGFTTNGVSVETTGVAQVFVNNTTIRNCVSNGINITPSASTDVTITNSAISFNGIGVYTGANGVARLSGNTISYNTTGIAPTGRGAQIVSFGNNTFTGNLTDGVPTSTATQQ